MLQTYGKSKYGELKLPRNCDGESGRTLNVTETPSGACLYVVDSVSEKSSCLGNYGSPEALAEALEELARDARALS